MVATQFKSRQVLGFNQRQYEGLKTVLQLNLRRQLLIAVCDSDVLQTQLIARLQTDIATSDKAIDDSDTRALEQLQFDPTQPDLVVQLVHWLKQAPKPTPHLQVVGLGEMTHQPMRSQNHFLRSLESIQSLLPYLNSSLVLWLSWPWYRTLEQSAPEFWQWRSGVFTFVGEPVTKATGAPVAAKTDGLYGESQTTQSASADIWQALSEDLAQLERSAARVDSSIDSSTSSQSDSQPDSPSDTSPDTYPDTSTDSQLDISTDSPEKAIAESAVVSNGGDPLADAANVADAIEERKNTTATSLSSGLDVTTLKNPLRTLARLESQGATAEEMVQAYQSLGHHYRDRIEAGEVTPNLLSIAIETFERYLHWLPEDDVQRAAGLNDLGTLHWLQAQYQSDRTVLIKGMNRSAELYRSALACIDNIDANTSSRLYGNLGAVYSALANYDDSVTNLKLAVTAYRQALPFCSAESTPHEYGTLQNSLGSVYWKLAYYEQPKPCLHRAIAAYNEALRCHHPETAPLDYAAVQNNLGIAYWSLSRHERPVFLLKHAIAAYRDALNYRNPATDASACASTYNNLGTAFWELANHPEAPADPKGRYQQNAVIAYEAALKASEMAPSSLDLPSIRHCLGSIYDKAAHAASSQSEISGNLKRALAHYIAALKIIPKNTDTYEPIFKALVRNVAAHYDLLGITGQKQALNQIPAELLPDVMLKV